MDHMIDAGHIGAGLDGGAGKMGADEIKVPKKNFGVPGGEPPRIRGGAGAQFRKPGGRVDCTSPVAGGTRNVMSPSDLRNEFLNLFHEKLHRRFPRPISIAGGMFSHHFYPKFL